MRVQLELCASPPKTGSVGVLRLIRRVFLLRILLSVLVSIAFVLPSLTIGLLLLVFHVFT